MSYALLDTNVLLTFVATRPGHEAARAWLDGEHGLLATTPQILREFLSVATRPIDQNGLGLASDLAVAYTEAIARRARLLPDDVQVHRRLRALLREGRAAGKQIHDANIVANGLVHGAERIVTLNVRHFARFADLIEIVSLA